MSPPHRRIYQEGGSPSSERQIIDKMCPYTQVHYKCGHRVYTVRSWCDKYNRTHVRCKVFVVAYERRYVRTFTHTSPALLPGLSSTTTKH